MKTINRTVVATFLGLGLTFGSVVSLQAAGFGGYQYYRDYRERDTAYASDLRGLVDRTQSDLQAAASLEHAKEDQRKRYSDAQGHLSTFDRKLTRGKFDKGELGKSIDKIKEILDKNVLQASTRDALTRDFSDLKVVRARRD